MKEINFHMWKSLWQTRQTNQNKQQNYLEEHHSFPEISMVQFVQNGNIPKNIYFFVNVIQVTKPRLIHSVLGKTLLNLWLL